MFIAGGTDMLQLLQESVISPTELIDINRLPLAGIETDADGARIGALTRLADVADDERIRQRFPLLAQALSETASPQVRNMATVGGNLMQRTRCSYFRDAASPCNKRAPGTGCPAMDGQNRMTAILGGSNHCIAAYPGDLAVALLALDAELVVQGPRTRRRMMVAELHRQPGDTPHIETTLQPGEIITAVLIPNTAFARSSHYLKLRDRATFEWALVSAAVALAMDGRVVRQARVAAGGVGTRPWRLPQVERVLVGEVLDARLGREAGDVAVEGVAPRTGNAFKVPLLQRAVERAVMKAGEAA
jgi:xanthine dehydrogenase YagS FAD-binding subunit